MRIRVAVAALLVIGACGGEQGATQGSASPGATLARSTEAPAAPTLARSTAAPATAGALSADDQKLVGSWRVYSTRLFFDAGGASPIQQFGPGMVIGADGTWQLETSSGKWSTAPITDADWKKWGSNPYGPTRKVVFDGFNGSSADGPIEVSSSGGRVDFFWLIYRVAPPTVQSAGTVHTKYGH